jgi:hypothetical protein
MVETVIANRVAYWLCTAFACICAFLSYYPFGSGIDIVAIDFACAALWVLFFSATVHFARKIGWGRWWVAVTGPFALFHTLELLLIVFLAKTGRFTP